MPGRRTLLLVVVSLLVIAILIAAGVALYRLGYARGLTAADGPGLAGPFLRPDLHGLRGFGDGRLQVWGGRGDMFHHGYRPLGMLGIGGWFVGLLALGGVLALLAVLVYALTARPAAPAQPVPAPPVAEPAPAKPARRAGRTRTTKP